MSVASILKELRTTKDITQEELAAKLNISQSSITAYENGNRTPKLELLKIFAKFYGVDMNYLSEFKLTNSNISEFTPEDIQFLRLYVQAPSYIKDLVKVTVAKSVSAAREAAGREPIAREPNNFDRITKATCIVTFTVSLMSFILSCYKFS